jgi:hypothetical protein
MAMLALLAAIAQGKGQPINSIPVVHGFCPTFPLVCRMIAHFQKEPKTPAVLDSIQLLHAYAKYYRNYLSTLANYMPVVQPFLLSAEAHYNDLTCSHLKATDLWKQVCSILYFDI